jgi:2-polyprenyl-3-methyl-5-hydroxy-6-metoxy-1,4-benzoquinol methylase
MKAYEELAPYYDRFMSFIDYETEAEYIYRFLFQQQKISGHVLDIGAGSGGHMLPLLRMGIKVDGLDVSDNMIEILKTKIEQEGFTSCLLHEDMRSFQTDNSYDIHYCFGETIHHLTEVTELVDFFHCSYQALNTGGILLFSWQEKSYFTELVDCGDFYECHNDDYLLWQAKVLSNEAATISYTAFIKNSAGEDVYQRLRESHRLAIFDSQQIRQSAHNAGFRCRPDLETFCFGDLLAEEPYKHITILEKVD